MPTDCSDIILRVREVSREIAGNEIKKKTVDSISFDFRKCRNYNIIGPSGAGKSSFLRLLNRLDDPTEGEIFFKQKPLVSYKPTELRKNISLLFQEPYLFPGTVKDNLEYCQRDCTDNDIKFHLERVGVNQEFAQRNVFELSVGERQRVAIARSLMMNPDILLLDEPTSSLDPSSARTIEQLILSLIAGANLTTIIVTHNPEQARRMGGETLLLVSGRLAESGETDELLTNPRTEMGKKYVNWGLND
jgi:putative ABC transport system ATP-binding protein